MGDIRSAQDVAIKDEQTLTFTQVKEDPDVSSEHDLLTRGRLWLWDEENTQWHKSLCDEDGRLVVSAFNRPSGWADASNNYKDVNVKKNTDSFESFLITNGKELVIERFGGGTYSSVGKIELYEGSGADPPGGSWNFIQAIYLSAESNEVDVKQTFIGDGTKEIGIRFVNSVPTDNEFYGYYVAYEV